MESYAALVLVLVFLPLLALTIVWIKKSRKTTNKVFSIVSCVLASVLVLVCAGVGSHFEEVNESEKTQHKEANWRDDFSAELVEEIESAFEEIGENPKNIISIEYVDIHTSGYVFEQKCYKVEFKWSFGKPGYKHSRYYRIVTQNYYEGEPEKEEYPNEFLCTIKYWAGDDGHGTNINQWSWTGNGKMQ